MILALLMMLVALIFPLWCIAVVRFTDSFSEWISISPQRAIKVSAKKLKINVDENQIDKVIYEIGSYKFADFQKYSDKILSSPLLYSETKAFMQRFPGVIEKASLNFSRRKRLVRVTGLVFASFIIIISAYTPQTLRNAYEPRLKINEIRRTVEANKLRLKDTALDDSLLKLRDLSIRLQNEDSVSEIRSLTEDILILSSDVAQNIKDQQAERTMELELIRKELNHLEIETQKLIKIEAIEEDKKKILRDFYTQEIVRSSYGTFWLGVAVTFVLQIIAIIFTPFIQSLTTAQSNIRSDHGEPR